jgi:tripartite-type tricarboxylate transporter receptor subunit TctC
MNAGRRRLLQTAVISPWLAAGPVRSQDQAFESVRIVTGFTPGGTSDTICRRVAEKLRPGYARNAQVENRTGAGGQIAVTAMKSAAADGATILQTPMSMLGIYPHIYRKLPYDPFADVTPVSQGAVFDFGFAVGPQVPAGVKGIADFLAWCKANPAMATFGSPAAGSTPHFIGALIGRTSGVELRHAAYRGTQPAILEMMGGQVAAVCGPVGEFTQHIAGGKCRLLATSGAQRNKFAPTTPTLVEQGLNDFVYNEWFGFYLPAKADPEVVRRLNSALVTALASPDLVAGLETVGLEARSSTPAELARLLQVDHARWGPLVKAIGFTAES